MNYQLPPTEFTSLIKTYENISMKFSPALLYFVKIKTMSRKEFVMTTIQMQTIVISTYDASEFNDRTYDDIV